MLVTESIAKQSIVQYSAAQQSTAYCSTAEYSILQHRKKSAAKYSIAWYRRIAMKRIVSQYYTVNSTSVNHGIIRRKFVVPFDINCAPSSADLVENAIQSTECSAVRK